LVVPRIKRRLLIAVARRPVQHVLIEIDDIPALFDIVTQKIPRDGIVTGTDAEKPAELHHRIFGLPRSLVEHDHEMIDRSDPRSAHVVDCSAFDLV